MRRKKPEPDPFDLNRFLEAQNHDGAIGAATGELRAGRKESHWMWFVFPQLRGLGRSAMAERYGISGLDEAKAYLAHKELGSRLMLCATILLRLPEHAEIDTVMGGELDALKLRSSMTLFARAYPFAAARESYFDTVVTRFFGGEYDPATVELLAGAR